MGLVTVTLSTFPTTPFLFSGDDIIVGLTVDDAAETIDRQVSELQLRLFANRDKTIPWFDYPLVITDIKPRVQDGETFFNISLPLDTFVSSVFSKIDSDASGANRVERTDYFLECRFEISSYNIFGDRITSPIVEPVKTFLCIKGDTEENTKYITEYVAQYGSFLTFQPKETYVTHSTPMHFSWFCRIAGAFEVFVQVKLLNDTDELHSILVFTVNTELIGTHHFNFTYNQVKTAIGDQDFKEVAFFIRRDTGNNASDVKLYKIVSVREFTRTIVFENSLGGFDTVPVHGKLTNILEYDRTLVEHDEYVRNIKTEKTQTYTVSSGFLNFVSEDANNFANYMAQELMASRNIYLISRDGISEVRCTNSDVQVYRDAEYRPFAEIDLTEIRKLKGYQQPTVILPPGGSTPVSYFEVGYIEDGYYESI